MEWLQSISKAIEYMENNLTENITVEDVSTHVYSSNAHFQRIFYLVTGITIGEYIRNRRLSLAGKDLSMTKSKAIDIGLKYQYETAESFTKAFTRFHGIKPSEAQKKSDQLKFFYPLTINLSIRGGFEIMNEISNKFYWNEVVRQSSPELSDQEKYKAVIEWAGKARSKNPGVFDELTEWILNDNEWTPEKLKENEEILMQGVLARFRDQNMRLREYLIHIKTNGVVNEAVYHLLIEFDRELQGKMEDCSVKTAVDKMFNDFSCMSDRSVREQIAGCKTGPYGTDSVELFGYINRLKDCDARVQWSLFMPEEVKAQQDGFRMTSFEYKRMPAMRFIGFEGDEYGDDDTRVKKMSELDKLDKYKSGFDYDILLMHFDGKGIDVGTWRGIWGRFMKENTPVPEGFISFDFTPENDGKAGAPFLSEFAFAQFEGDVDAMHKHDKGVDPIYDITRNTILGHGVSIPYPMKYWTAEVCLDSCAHEGAAYLFCTEQ